MQVFLRDDLPAYTGQEISDVTVAPSVQSVADFPGHCGKDSQSQGSCRLYLHIVVGGLHRHECTLLPLPVNIEGSLVCYAHLYSCQSRFWTTELHSPICCVAGHQRSRRQGSSCEHSRILSSLLSRLEVTSATCLQNLCRYCSCISFFAGLDVQRVNRPLWLVRYVSSITQFF